MGKTDALARARRLLSDGFVISAANVLVHDARDVARLTLEPLGSEPHAVEARRDALAHALSLVIARLQQHRDAIGDALASRPPLRPSRNPRRPRSSPANARAGDNVPR